MRSTISVRELPLLTLVLVSTHTGTACSSASVAPVQVTTDDAAPPTDDCSSEDDCPPGTACYFAIGSCSPSGRCLERPAGNGPQCGVIVPLCGCNGSMVETGCGYPNGYSSGPTLGDRVCTKSASAAKGT
jgi:hypothetical protein